MGNTNSVRHKVQTNQTQKVSALLPVVLCTHHVFPEDGSEPEFAFGIFHSVAEPDVQQGVVAAFQS